MNQFKPGDRIAKVSGRPWYDGTQVTVVDYVDGVRVHPIKPNGWMHYEDLRLVPPRSVAATEADQAFKADAGKPLWHLLVSKQGCATALASIVDVLTIAVTPKDKGGKGYKPHSWRDVPEAKERYLSALYRHMDAINRGEIMDDGPDGTGKAHWDCVATNALFLRELHDEEISNATSSK